MVWTTRPPLSDNAEHPSGKRSFKRLVTGERLKVHGTMTPSEDDLYRVIADAARGALTQLFSEFPTHHFYYVAVITTGEGSPPVFTAWSHEALRTAAGDDAGLMRDLKWSYADSPFCGYGQQWFESVRRLFALRPALDPLDESGWDAEVELRLRAMERAIAALDEEGLFGTGSRRLGIVVNAEVMPPDYTNVVRARRLNPGAALTDWLAEAAEPD